MNGMQVVLAVAFGIAGVIVGWLFCLLMEYSLKLIVCAQRYVACFILLALVRLVLFGGGLVAAMYVHYWCLITYVAGFVVARTFLVSKVGTACDKRPAAPKGKERDD